MKRFKIMMGILWVLFGLSNMAQMTNVIDAEDEEEDGFGDVTNEADLSPILPFGQALSTNEALVGLKYEAIDLDEVLKQYSEWTGLAILKAPDVPAVKITLKCPKRLPKREALLAIEGVLGMNGVALVPMGDKFLKVVPIAAARQYGMETGTGIMDKNITDTDKLVSRIVDLKHIDIAEAQGTIQSLLHSYGRIMPLERVNCILITDTAINIKRILEILDVIDQPIESREEMRIFPITYAKASEIMGKIEAILADAQARDTKTRLIRQQLTTSRMPMQPLQPPHPGQPTPTTSVVDLLQPASERGIIQGKVKMVADDRTNGLIIITRPEHFRFIEQIIKALDRQVEPDVSIKVFSLEYASAKDVVSLLTSLVSAAAAGTKTPTPTPTPTPAQTATAPLTPSFASRDSRETKKSDTAAGGSEEIQISGKLSSDVKIIADPRTNALLIMATKADMATIEDLLIKLDVSLAQVLIEVVIIEVELGKDFKMGIDWLQKSMIAYNNKQGGGRRAFMGYAGSSMQGADGQIIDATAITDASKSIAAAGSGLTYYFSIFDLNIDAVLNMLQTSSDTRILSTPIILTTDNKEARIMVGEKRPIVTSTSISSGGTQQSGYEYKDIGIELTVTPHINKKGFVVMEISQKVNNVGGNQTIDGNLVPIITTREFGASISVNDRKTIVLGGLVGTEKKDDQQKIPFLGDIPLLGYLFRYQSDQNKRAELMVMITPYVLKSPQDVYQETARRFNSMQKADDLLRKDWSETELGKPMTAEQLRNKEREETRDELEKKASEKELSREAERAARKAEREAKKIKVQGGSGANADEKGNEKMPGPDGVPATNTAAGTKS
ncbi:MAG: type II secretion system secretin GspD [Verrucomicrobia bacterium]|nr:type II secretion system secretin GspD [Verrucomicrobiota bacterium]MCG2679065.1 type II secretion system secretin GspD [Kiritimatiellia bacterium]MBU4247592.1 type II secretion system secretin GspD [Verrucomicrobiota bacterium]MBU4291206.1 type II secretion system secretin GspD [Verrucomicrobiota bacterium]MBU4428452.1 type II secretion system secretin GspD [Verrucomicrobiota bacterium]